MKTSNALKTSSGARRPPLPSLEEIRAEKARRRLHEFILATYPSVYESGWFHKDVCARLDRFLAAVRAKQSPRLILQAPPRHGKSEIVSRRFPAFALGKDPNLSLIATSYGFDLAARMNRDVQRIIDSDAYSLLFPETNIPGRRYTALHQVPAEGYARTSEEFEIVEYQGAYRAAGIGGGITGMGADLLLIDDPVKDAAQAYSENFRQRLWEWYTSTAYTRLMPGGGILIVMTRWHEDDLVGRLLRAMEKEDGEKWELVSYPAIAEKDEPHRKTGEALHPARYSLEALARIKTAVGSAVWTSLYQQRPAPAGGTIFQRSWFNNRWRRPGEKELDGVLSRVVDPRHKKWMKLLISVDCAFKKTLDSDRVCIGVWGYDPPDRYLLDVRWQKMSFLDTLHTLIDVIAAWPKARERIIEDKANGPAVIEILKRRFSGIVEVNPLGGKEARASAVSPYVEGGNLWLPLFAPWVSDYVEEMVAFPRGANDDAVDMTSQALMRLATNSEAERFRKLTKLS
jgi:predicted phage terminase large subunit-like protein